MSHFPRKFDFAEQLMVLPVPLRIDGGRAMFEQQACNGVARWADHFDTLIVACPIIPDEIARERKSMAWRDIATIPCIDRIEFVGLPWGRTPRTHKAALPDTRLLLTQLIERSEYLHFGIGGLFGDWAGIAAQEAMRLRRPYAVHMDRVEDELVRRNARGKSFIKRIKAAVVASMMKKWHRQLISNASLSMCHGSDTFAAYRELNRNSFLVHNIHTTAEDQATAAQIEEKIARAQRGEELRICYAGRLDAEKAPLDWVRAIAHATRAGVRLKATWLGDGALRETAKMEAATLAVSQAIHFAGFTSDRAQVLNTIRENDLFLFTHVTPESPRCLIESLISATPITGYESHYPADLIKEHHGGVLTPMGRPEALGDAVVTLAKDRSKLVDLIRSAAADGKQFTSEAVFAHRAELIKKYLPRVNKETAKARSREEQPRRKAVTST